MKQLVKAFSKFSLNCENVVLCINLNKLCRRVFFFNDIGHIRFLLQKHKKKQLLTFCWILQHVKRQRFYFSPDKFVFRQFRPAPQVITEILLLLQSGILQESTMGQQLVRTIVQRFLEDKEAIPLILKALVPIVPKDMEVIKVEKVMVPKSLIVPEAATVKVRRHKGYENATFC